MTALNRLPNEASSCNFKPRLHYNITTIIAGWTLVENHHSFKTNFSQQEAERNNLEPQDEHITTLLSQQRDRNTQKISSAIAICDYTEAGVNQARQGRGLQNQLCLLCLLLKLADVKVRIARSKFVYPVLSGYVES